MEKERGVATDSQLWGGLGLNTLPPPATLALCTERERVSKKKEEENKERERKREWEKSWVNSLFLEAPLKRLPHLNSPFFSSVPALPSLFFLFSFITVFICLRTRYGPLLPGLTCSFFVLFYWISHIYDGLCLAFRFLFVPWEEDMYAVEKARVEREPTNGANPSRAESKRRPLEFFTELWRLRSNGGAHVREPLRPTVKYPGRSN